MSNSTITCTLLYDIHTFHRTSSLVVVVVVVVVLAAVEVDTSSYLRITVTPPLLACYTQKYYHLDLYKSSCLHRRNST